MALGRRVVKRAISRVASPKRAASALQNLQKAIAANRVAPWHAELHPRDRFGKFRNSFKLPPVVQRTIDRMLATFKHKRFRDQKEADDYLIQQPRRARYTPEQSKIVDDFLTPEGNTRIEAALRQDADLDAKYWTPPGTDRPVEVPGHEIHTMEAMVRPTEDDLILTRTTDYAPFGLTPQNADEIEEWTGWLVRDKGFAPTKIGNPIPEAELQSRDRPPPHVTWSIVAPAGTRAIIPGDRGGADPSTVILDKDQDLRITRVVKHPGGHYVYAVATPRRGKGEAPRALGKRLSPRERAFKRQGLNPDGIPITSPAARPVPPRGTPAPGEEGLPPTTPVEAGPPLKRVKPAKAIKQAGEEVPVGAGRVTREEQPERPRIARERETARALEQERKARGRGQVSTPEEVQRAADERRAARQAEMEARREARRANLEITRLKIAEAREKRLDERQKRFDDFRDQQLIRQDSEIEQLRRRLEARELPAEGATEGGINVQAMTPSQRKDIVDRDRRLRDLGQGYPHEDNSEEMRIARAADEIRAMPPEERGAVPEGVRQARPTPPPPAGLAAGPQPGYDVKETLPNGRTRTGRVVSISEDGVTVRWRDGTQNPDLDPEDPKLAFTRPRAKRPRLTREAREARAAAVAKRFPEREDQVKPRANYGIFWTDENGELVRGKVVKRNRNGLLTVQWDDGTRENDLDPNDTKYRFENTKEVKQREAAAAREAKKAEKAVTAEKKQRQIRFQESERRLLTQADAIKARGGPAGERERRIVRIAAMLRGEEVPEKVEPPLGLTTPTRRELTPDVRARLERDNNIGREAEDIAKAGGPKTAYQRQIVRQAEDIRRAEEAFQAARRERVRAGLTPEERDLYDLSVADLNRLASENGIEGNVGDIGRLPLIQRIRERDIVAGDLGKPRAAKAVKKAAPPAPVKKAVKAAPAVKKAAPSAKKVAPPTKAVAPTKRVAEAAPSTREIRGVHIPEYEDGWRTTGEGRDRVLGSFTPSQREQIQSQRRRLDALGDDEDGMVAYLKRLSGDQAERLAWDENVGVRDVTVPSTKEEYIGRIIAGRRHRYQTSDSYRSRVNFIKARQEGEAKEKAAREARAQEKVAELRAAKKVTPAAPAKKVAKAAAPAPAKKAKATPSAAAEPRPVKFAPSRAKSYSPAQETKYAEVVKARKGKKTTIQAEWGADQHFVGPWVRVIDPETGKTKYGSALSEWMDMHERVPGTKNGWQKTAKVDAYQHHGAPRSLTTVLADGTVETTNTVNDGDWIVKQKNGEVQVIKDEKFRKLYQIGAPRVVRKAGPAKKVAAAPVKKVAKAAPAKPTITREKTSAAEVAKWREQAKAAGLPSDLAGLRAEAKQRGWKGYSAWDVTTLRRRLLEGGGTAEIQQPRAARRVAKTVARKVQEPVAVERTGKEIVDSLSPTERREWDSLSLGDKADYIDRRRRNPAMKHGEALFLARGNLGPGGERPAEAPAPAKAVRKVAKAAPERPVIKKAAAPVKKAAPAKAAKAIPRKLSGSQLQQYLKPGDAIEWEGQRGRVGHGVVDRITGDGVVHLDNGGRITPWSGQEVTRIEPTAPAPVKRAARAVKKVAPSKAVPGKERATKGELYYKGANEAADFIVTRTNPDTGQLEMIRIRRGKKVRGKNPPAIPGGFRDGKETAAQAARRELREETGADVPTTGAREVFRGKVTKDPRNTDESWVATTVLHRHLSPREAARVKFTGPEQKGEVAAYGWEPVTPELLDDLYADHGDFVRRALRSRAGDKSLDISPEERRSLRSLAAGRKPTITRATKKAVKAAPAKKATVTRAPTKVENADDVIRNSATILRQPEHPGWDIIQHKGNKRWYIIDPKGNLHRDGRVTSSLTMEGAQKRLARIPQPTPAQRGAQKVKAEAADLRQAAKGLRRKGETDRAENLEKAAGILDKRAAELVPERKPRVTRAAKKAAPAEEVVPRGYERRLFNGNPVLVRKGEPEIGPGDSVDFRTGRVMKAGSPELRARISKGLAEQAERAGWGNDVQGFVRSGGVVKKAAPAKKTARATVLARIARLPEAQRTEVQALQRPEQAAYFDARDRKVPHARALADALSQIQKPGRLRAKKAVPEAEIQQPRAARVAERPVIKKAGAVVPTPSQRKVLEALDRGERKFARADVGKRLQDNGWLEYKDGVPRLTDAGRAAIGKKVVPSARKELMPGETGAAAEGRITTTRIKPGTRLIAEVDGKSKTFGSTRSKTKGQPIDVISVEKLAPERRGGRGLFRITARTADGTEVRHKGGASETHMLASEAPAVAKKAVTRPTIKKATPTSMEGRARPNGRIPLGALRPGDRIHVDTSRGNHSALPTTRKTGVSTITVDRIEQVAQERGFQRTTKRFQVIGHDADGTEIIVPGAGAGRGWPGHQTFLAAPEAPPVKKAVKKAAPERPVIKRAPKKAVPEAPAPVKKAVKRAPVGTSGTSETKPETLTALRKRAGTAGVRGASRMQRPELETALARHEAGDTSVAKPERPTITRAPRAGMTVRQAQTQSAVDVANKYQYVMPEEHDGVRQKVVQGLASGDLTPTAARSILRRESERLLREARESRAKGDHNKANAASKAHVYYDLMQDDMVIKKLTPAVEKYRSGGGPTVTPLPARPQRAVPSVPTKTAPVKKAAAVVEAPAPARTVRKQIVPDLVRGDLEKARDAREMGEILDDLHLGNNKEAWRNLARDVGVKPPRLRDRRSPAQIRKQIIDTYDEERKHLDEILPVHVPGPEGKVRRLMAPAATKPRAKSAWARKRDLPENAYNPNSGHRPRQVLDDADAIYMASDRDDAHRFVDSLDNVRFNNLLREMDIPREEKTRDELTDSLLTKVREKEPKAKSIQKSATELRHERTFQFKDLMERHDLEHGIRTVAGRNALRHGLAQYTESGDKESVIEALRREADELETRDLSGNNILGQAAGLSPDQRRQIAKADADQIRRFADSFERQGTISLGGPGARPHVTRQAPKVRGPKAKRPAETTAQAIERMTRIGPLSESEEDLPEFEKAFRAVKATAPAKKAVAAAVPERPTITRETPRRPVSGPGGTIKALPEAGREKLLTRLRNADSPEAVEKILEDEQVNGSDLQEIMHDIGIGDRATLRIPERRKAIAQQLKGEIQQPVGRPRLRAAQRADLEALSPAERADYEANIDRGLPHDRALAEALAQVQKPGRQRAVKKAVPGRPKITRAARKALPVADRVEALRRAEAAGKAPEVVPFYGKESPFSQHHPAPFEIDGVRYPTAEHYMMAEKARMFGDDETLAKILATPSPVEAKRLGRKVKGFDAERWDAVSDDIARQGNLAKFEQNPDLRDALLATGDKVLAEASPRDTRWGIGRGRGDADLPSKWRGENRLGFALMDVRAVLKRRGAKKTAPAKKAAAPVKKAAAPVKKAAPTKRGFTRGIPGGGGTNLPEGVPGGGAGVPGGGGGGGREAKRAEQAPAAKKVAAPAKKAVAAAEKEEKFLPPLANGTKRKSATNLRVGDVTTGPSGQWGAPHTITAIERIDGHHLRITRDDGKVEDATPNNAFWMGTPSGVGKGWAPKATPTKKVAPKAVRPTIKRAPKVPLPTAKPIERMKKEELHAEIERRKRAGEDLGATQLDFTNDELRRVLAGERVELRGAQRRAAAKARGAERAAAPRKTPVRESLSTHEAAQRIKAAKTHQEVVEATQLVRNRDSLNNLLVDLGMSGSSDRSRPLSAIRQQIIEGWSPEENPEIRRAKPKPLRKVAARAERPTIKREARTKKVAEAPRSTTPAIDEDVPLLGDPEGDNSIMHGDSGSMQLAQAYANLGRNGTANKLMQLRHDISETRRGRDNGDLDGPQKLLDELRALRAQETDIAMQRNLDEAIREMNFPQGPDPDLPEGTPQAARQLLHDLARIPVARAPKGSRLHGFTTMEDSPVDRLAQIFREVAGSKGEVSVGDIERRIERVLGTYHESVDGSYRMQSLWHRLDRDSSLSKELKEWVGRLREPGPLMGNKKLGPNTRGMLSERRDLTPGTPAIKKPKQLTKPEIKKLTDGQVVSAFEANKISRADAAAELRSRALDLDTAAGHLELREHHIGHPEALEMRRVADKNRDLANQIETGTLLRTGEKPTAQVAAERKALREATRAKAKRIATAQGRASYARDLEQLLEATSQDGDDNRLRTLIGDRFRSAAPGNHDEALGWDTTRAAIGEMLPNETRQQFQERMRDVLRNHGIEVNGNSGDWLDYDPDNHQLLAGTTKAGNAVQTLIPGISYRDEDGSLIELSKPLVRTKADALKEGIVPDRVTLGRRGTGRLEKGTLTGEMSRTDRAHDLLTEDTKPEGVPVRDLTLGNGYKISEGRAVRRDGITYIAEHDPADAKAVSSRIRRMQELHDRIPAEGRQFQRSYVIANGHNPDDAQVSKRIGHDMEARATAGGGQLHIWQAGKKDFGGDSLEATVLHETGHNIAHGVRDRKLGATHGRYGRWNLDAAADGNPQEQGRIFGFKPRDNHIARRVAPILSSRYPKGTGRFRHGSTTYGEKDVGEDFADSHALYAMGPIGEGKLTPNGPTEPIYFRDLWPHKAAHLDEIYPEFGARQVEEIAARRGGRAPVTGPLTQISAPNIPPKLRSSGRGRKAVTVVRRPRAAQIQEPRQARAMGRGIEEGEAVWPEPNPSLITRRPDGTFTGRLNSNEGMARMLPRDTGPEGVPVRSLTLPNGYQMPIATAWRHDGVTYVIQHRDNDVSRARAKAVKERLREFHSSLPAEAQRWQRSYAFALDPSPQDSVYKQRYNDPNFASSASAGGGNLTIWDSGTHLHLERGDALFYDDLRHEVGHNAGKATGAVPAFDRPSPRVSEIVRTSDPRGRVRDFVPLPRDSSRTLFAAVKNWGRFKPPPGVKIMVPNGVTPYGRMSHGENFAEAHMLYLMGIVGYGKLGNSNRSEPIYFRDLFPEWAALFDEMYPGFAQRQLAIIADERLPQRPRITRAPRRIQASAVRGSHTLQYHLALSERS